jgi:UDP-N-acetylglucosamine--N-acetylmuramyl-(pentapeptide) pyrophosphoryl-undecaprenol N-acetylglucosamine transferase
VILAGGGTGGHIYPGIAVAEELRRRNPRNEILFVGSARGIEAKLVPEAGFAIELLPVTGFPRKPGPGQLAALFRFLVSLVRVARLLLRWKPDVVLGTGGYVSGPAVLVAVFFRVPTLIQEQNSIPGITNRLLGNLVREVHINFSESRAYFRKKANLRLTGNPIRMRPVGGGTARTYERFRLDENRKTVFVFGGSLGAHSINRALLDALPRFDESDQLQIIIQTGTEDYDMVLSAVRRGRIQVTVRSYLPKIEEAYGIADLVVSRAGAMTLSEITAFGLPAVLVPYPHAVYNHQVVNARALVSKGAAEMILDSELSGETLAATIRRLLKDPARLRSMSQNARSLARHDARERIAMAIERLAGKGA